MGDGMSEQPVAMEQVKAAMKAAWMAGDFGVVAKQIGGDAEAFAESLGPVKDLIALDVATGTGNLGLALLRRGAVVTGVDIATNLLEQGRARAEAEGLTMAFDEGDAEALPYADASYDLVVSMFGAMFAPQPDKVVSEFARVLKPGGMLAMANWNPESFSAKMFRVSSKHVPPPAGLMPPVLWGDVATVTARLDGDFEQIATELRPMMFDLPVSPAGAVEFFRTNFGPTQMAMRRLDDDGKKAMTDDLEQLWSNHNVATEPGTHTVIQNEYLKVTAMRKIL